MSRILDNGPLRRLLRAQEVQQPSLSWGLYWMSVDSLKGETNAHDLYIKLAQIARSVGQPDIAAIYDEIAKDEADHYQKIRHIILPKLVEMLSGMW